MQEVEFCEAKLKIVRVELCEAKLQEERKKLRRSFLRSSGPFVYRLGHEILNLKRRVRFP